MAGHSKWKQIKHRKAAQDAKRGTKFTKLIKEITVAARQGRGDPSGNPRLRVAIEAARAGNMPAENIDRAIKKGTGELAGVVYEEATYEGYGPGGAAILVQVTSDNLKRTVAEIRHLFSRTGGNLGAPNSVAWMFEKKGQLYLEAERYSENDVLEAALDAGAEDMTTDEGQHVITADAARLHSMRDTLEAKGFTITSVEIAMIPQSAVKVEGKEAEQLLRLADALEDHDDVSKVFSNFDIDQAKLAAVGG